MEHWRTLKRGTVSIYMEYGDTHTGNLTVENIRLCVSSHLELALDLGKNLRTRHKGTGSFLDARSLADGDMADLRFIQIEDSSLLEQVEQELKQGAISVEDMTLRIDLERTWSFKVVPENPKGPWLALRVLSTI